MNEKDEIQLIDECRKGNRQAFNLLVHRYSSTVYSFAFRLMNNITDAEDLCQEVFIQAFRGIKKFEGRSSFSTWLYRITVNLWKNKLKEDFRQGRGKFFSLNEMEEPGEGRSSRELPDFAPSIEEIVDKNARVEVIKKCLQALHPTFRAIIILRDIEGKAYTEIAEILDCPLGTVQSRLCRARQELRFKVLETLREKNV